MESKNAMNLKEDFVETTLNEQFVTVFSKSYCPYCDQTKNTL